jgi:hypothetical protein
LYYNSHRHSAANTKGTLLELKSEALDQPPYSSDLVPSDLHLLGPLKEALRDRRFAVDKEVKEGIHDWRRTQNSFYGKINLVDRWTKCIEKQGDK